MHSNQENKVYIRDLDKAELLATLYSFAFYKKTEAIYLNMPSEEFVGIAQSSSDVSSLKSNILEDIKRTLIEKKGDIDYFGFISLKVNLSGDYLDTWLYNRDNGQELAEKVVEELRKKQVSSQVTTLQVESHAKERGK